jgi:hypothetical protein
MGRDGATTISVGPSSSSDYPSLTAAVDAAPAQGAWIQVEPEYSAPVDTIRGKSNLVISGPNRRGAVNVGRLTFDSTPGAIRGVDILGLAFSQVEFNPGGKNNISDIGFLGTELNCSASGGGVRYNNSSTSDTNYVQQVHWRNCRFDDWAGGATMNVVGGSNPSAGGYLYEECFWVVGGSKPAAATWLSFPPGSQMGTYMTLSRCGFTVNNPAGGAVLCDIPAQSAQAWIHSLLWDRCYFELHGPTIGVHVGAFSGGGMLKFYTLFDHCTYNIDVPSGWTHGAVSNTQWKAGIRNGRSGFCTHYGHRDGPNPFSFGEQGAPTADYAVETIDPSRFLT